MEKCSSGRSLFILLNQHDPEKMLPARRVSQVDGGVPRGKQGQKNAVTRPANESQSEYSGRAARPQLGSEALPGKEQQESGQNEQEDRMVR